jgi:NodT family efflux transporter outer membrane factor (OMF) lipoprotein
MAAQNEAPMSDRSALVVRCASVRIIGIALLIATAFSTGCFTSLREWADNGFKVGPNYRKPAAPVEIEWIDYKKDPRLKTSSPDTSAWWTVFNDPKLDGLVSAASQQNLTLRTAGTRILQAEAVRGFAAGSLFPQLQQAVGGYNHNQTSKKTANPAPRSHFDQWNAGFNLSWELDFWGKFRRGIESADAALDVTIEDYDNVLVLLLSDVASTYVQIRIVQEELRAVRENVRLQKKVLRIAEAQYKAGQADEADFLQTRNNVEQTEALIPEFESQLRQANDALCILLGIPPRDLIPELGDGPQFPIPTAPPDVAVGVPAELLRRRPDIREAERIVAAQCPQIGIAESQAYPAFAINGTLQWQAKNGSELFRPDSLAGSVGPSFAWNVLNYGRIANSVRQQQALFEQTVYSYQNTVLKAQQEAEDSINGFFMAQDQTVQLALAVRDIRALDAILLTQANAGARNFDRVFVVQAQATTQENNLATSQGSIALNLIRVYRALGGGWQIRLQAPMPGGVVGPNPPPRVQPEAVPAPLPPGPKP